MSINELLGRVLATYAVMHYMATPENLWEEYVFGLVQPYLVVEDAKDQLAWFYEGLPRNATIPWAIWIRPTFWWLSFIAALGLGSVALATILRRQWVEQERLPFPFAQVAEELAETAGPKGFPEYMKQPLFWAGFSIPAVIVLWYIIGYFDPSFPVITVGIQNYTISLGRYVPFLHGRLQLLNHRICVLYRSTSLIFNLGILDTHLVANRNDQSAGPGRRASANLPARDSKRWADSSYFVCGDCGLRGTISKQYFNRHFAKPKQMDDRNELMSYRTAVATFLACALFAMFWLFKGGMTPFWAVLGRGVLVCFLHRICQNRSHDRTRIPRIAQQAWAPA